MKMICFDNSDLTIGFLYSLCKGSCTKIKVALVSPSWRMTKCVLAELEKQKPDFVRCDVDNISVIIGETRVVGLSMRQDCSNLRGCNYDFVVVNQTIGMAQEYCDAIAGLCNAEQFTHRRNSMLSFLSRQDKSLVLLENGNSKDSVKYSRAFMVTEAAGLLSAHWGKANV